MQSRGKSSSTESTITKMLIYNEISHEDLTTVINEERNLELKESIRMMSSQRSNTKRNKLTEGGKKTNIEKTIRQNERIHRLKCKKMPSYCLQCKSKCFKV